MTTQNIVLLIMSLAFALLGLLLTTKEKVADWGLTHGHARLWIRLLGKERAMKLTRYFFGPLCMLFGALMLLVTLVELSSR